MKIAVIGSRDLTDKDWVYNVLDEVRALLEPQGEHTVFLLGGAAGVQEITLEYSKEKEHLVDYVLFKPWHLVDPRMAFVPRFFFMRNKQIVDNAHKVVVLRTETEDSEVDRAISYAEKRGKDILVVPYSVSEEFVE